MLRFCSIDTDLFSYAAFYAAVILFALIITFTFYVKIYRVLCHTTLAKNIIIGNKRNLTNVSGSQKNEQQGETSRTTLRRIRGETKIIKVSFRWSLTLSSMFMQIVDPITVEMPNSDQGLCVNMTEIST